MLLALAGYLGIHEWIDEHRYIAARRNFYGLLRVTTELETDEHTPMRKLMNGTILHGEQLSDPNRRREPTSYYGRKSGIGRAIALLQEREHLRVGVIGLGAGVLASYCRPGDTFRYYEINPLDIALAREYFTFLQDCPGDCKVLQGDARLTLERQPPQQFDVLAVDAFTSDSIPIHLLTREAFALYFRHLAPHGILAIHVTNRYLNLVPIVVRNAEEFGKPAYQVLDRGADGDYLAGTDWMLVGPDTHVFVLLGFKGASIFKRSAPKSLRTWTDDFSNLYEVLR
jgi:SAM-dependent methyltransferase